MKQSVVSNCHPRRDGIALVIVLSFVVLLTIVVVAFFSRALDARQMANNSLNASKTDLLTRNALDVIVNDLRQEIVNGSTVTSGSMSYGGKTYQPTVRANVVPMRSGNPAVGDNGTDPIPNLIRRSVGADSMPAPGVGSRASAVSSTTASANGRFVSLARWNQHYLVPKASADNTTTPVESFTAPDWVMITKEEGPAVLASPTKDATGNTVTAVGRYAYAVYDEGGLLDANVAGFPSALNNTLVNNTLVPGTKASLAYADLPTALANAKPAVTLSSTLVDQLVGWRNYATTQPSGTFPGGSFASNLATNSTAGVKYADMVARNMNGFLRTNFDSWNDRTNQTFLSRQQLIAYQRAAGLPVNALQYLGTFSRESNAPSWGPTYDATDFGGNSQYAYRTNSAPPTSSAGTPNRLLPSVHFANSGTVTSYRVDGTPFTYQVNRGDPLVQRRFPLGRLAWIGPNGPRYDKAPGVSQDTLNKAILSTFGLVWGKTGGPNPGDPGLLAANPSGVNVWRYVGSTGSGFAADTLPSLSGIKTLGNVATETVPREPNFFELLQAGLLSGSLAQDQDAGGGAYPWYTVPEGYAPLHIFRIGASIITQYQKPDNVIPVSYPTVIEYAISNIPVEAVGIDDLPYLNMYTAVGGADANGGTADNGACKIYALFGLWNPHQSVGTSARPPVRLCVSGQCAVFNHYGNSYYGSTAITNPASSVPPRIAGYEYSFSSSPTAGIQTVQLSSANGLGVNGFADPHVITPDDLQTDPGQGTAAGGMWASLDETLGTKNYAGFRLPDFYYGKTTVADPAVQLSAGPPAVYEPWWGIMQFDYLARSTNCFNCWLEFQNPSGKWIPYNYFSGIEHVVPANKKPLGFYLMRMYTGGDTTGHPAAPSTLDPTSNTYQRYYMFNSDPRTLRSTQAFGQSPGAYPLNTNYMRTSLFASGTETDYPAASDTGRIGTQQTSQLFGGASSLFGPAGLARNNTTAPVTPVPTQGHVNPGAYLDPDGIQRISDSGIYPSDTAPARSIGWQGDPYALSTDRYYDRPIVLHRPFTNVAELGYVSRDDPWRTLDFFTTRSADSGLLDLFTTSQNAESMSAGRINLNTRNVPALIAMLNGTTMNLKASLTTVSPQIAPPASDPTSISKPIIIATKLAALTKAAPNAGGPAPATTGGPLINKDEIVTRFGWSKTDASSPAAWTLSSGYPLGSNPDFSTTDEQNIKSRREAVTRALAEVGQTRTWNLLIDVVAQSGRYAQNAAKLENFTVEGERHYWLHVAIDRFTNKVIDQQLEAVTE